MSVAALFFKKKISCLSCLMLCISLLFAGQVVAQTKLKVGEEVKVLSLRKWTDGTVVEVLKRNQYRVSYVFVRETEGTFARSNIRKLCETEAIDFCRTWQSSGGGFSVVAAARKIDDENVTLIKPDMKEIVVPLAKLSAKDRSYAKKLKRATMAAIINGEVADKTPPLPEVQQFFESASTSFGSKALFGASLKQNDLLKPLPDYLRTFNEAGVGFQLSRAKQKMIAVVPVGGPEQLVLVSTRDDTVDDNGNPFQSQIYWLSLKEGKVVGTAAITPGHYATDYDPVSERLLTFYRKSDANKHGTESEDDEDYYTIWNLPQGGNTPKPVMRWSAGELSWASDIYAKLVAGDVVLAKTGRKTYTAWDFDEKREVYHLKQESFFEAPITLAPDRKHLILPQDKNVVVLDAETGEAVFSFGIGQRATGANINAAATKLAACTGNQIYVWDLKNPSAAPKIYPAQSVASAFKARLDWINDDEVLCEGNSDRVLYRLSLGLPIWSYQTSFRESLDRQPLLNAVVDGIVFYAARTAFGQDVAIGAVKLPGPAVAETVTNIDKKELNGLYPGVHLSLDVSGVSNPQKAKKWLEEKIKANEWVVDEDAEIKMIATMGRGKQRTETYRTFGAGARNRRDTQVTYTPYYANLQIKKGEEVLWRSGVSTGAPGTIRADPSSFQSEVNKQQVPQLEFFRVVKIASEVIHPKYSRGFGVSALSTRGIVVKSKTPPGQSRGPQPTYESELNRSGEQSEGDSASGRPVKN